MGSLWRRRSRPEVETVVETIASLAAAATGTPLPLGSVAKLAYELSGPASAEAKSWEQRLIAGVTGWLRANDELVAPTGGDAFEGWEERLIDAFNEGGAAGFIGSERGAREKAVEIVARAVFVPHTSSGWPAARRAAEALLDELPRLLVEAEGEHAGLAALRSVLKDDLGEVLAAVDALAGRFPPRVADRVALEAYLAALVSVLDSDPWVRLLGGPATSTLESSFLPRRVRLEATDKASELDVVADGCERLVLLGDPGRGKSWAARHLAIRAADRAAAQLDESPPADLESLELPLWARASAVLDAPDHVAPWEALTRGATEGLSDRIGSAGAAALRKRLDRPGGRYLVVLDGLDESVHLGDFQLLDRLADDPGRAIRLVLTSRPGAWRRQLSLDEARRPTRGVLPDGAHAIANVEPLEDDEVRKLVGGFVDGERRSKLLKRLETDEQVATLARTPLACVMLCIAAGHMEELPRGRVALFEVVATLVLRSTWREEISESAIAEAREALQRMAADGAHVDPATGLGSGGDVVSFPAGPKVSGEAMMAVDTAAPIAEFQPFTQAQSRRFLHASLRAQFHGEHLAGLTAGECADLLRDHLWFDPEWSEAVLAALVLHPERGAVLSRLVDASGPDTVGWPAIARLDGFGELTRLLVELVRETEASQWGSAWSGVLTRVAHEELARDERSPLRVDLARGGWPDDRSREEHLSALTGGHPLWPERDAQEGVASLRLSAAERRDAAARLTRRLATIDSSALQDAAVTLRILTDGDDDEALTDAVEALTRRAESSPDRDVVRALRELEPGSESRERVASALVDRLEAQPHDSDHAAVVTLLLAEPLLELDAADDLRARAGDKVLSVLRATDADDLYLLRGVLPLLGGDHRRMAAALEHLLKATGELGSYDTAVVAELIAAILRTGEPEQELLEALLDVPAREWPRWDLARGVIADLAQADDPDVRERTVPGIVDRLTTAELAGLGRLADLVSLLEPNPSEHERAEAILLERLRAAPAKVSLSAAEALRAIEPGPASSEGAARLLLERAESSDAVLRHIFADGALWFPATGDTRGRALDVLLEDPARSLSNPNVHIASWVGHANAEERARLAGAIVDLLAEGGPTAHPKLIRELEELGVEGDLRERSVRVLLERLRGAPHEHPGDWLFPAARLGASREELEAASDAVIEALDAMELHQGSMYALESIWEEVPLSDEQRTRAAHRLAERLSTIMPLFASSLAMLVDKLGVAAARERAVEVLKHRLETEPSDSDWLVSAITTLDPQAATGQPSDEDLLSELEQEWLTEKAELLASRGPTGDVRDRAAALLVDEATSQYVSPWELDQLERIADGLWLMPRDLPREVPEPGLVNEEAIRRLAASARRHSSGDEWREYLVSRPLP